MNRWAVFLAQTPPTLQRLIAASQRISLPRNCPASERLRRLRAALCRPAAVRAVYASLEPSAQQALQQLRALPRGLNAATLAARLGPIRPLAELRADRAPRTLSERLLLLGWLLPRPARRNHPVRYLLPPELRAWLPVPIGSGGGEGLPARGPVQDADADGLPAAAPALRATTALLAAAAAAPLPVRADGRPRTATLRALRPRLAPLAHADADALVTWLLPLLGDLGLLAPHGTAVTPGPAAERFLARAPAERLRALADAWVRAPRADTWLTRLRVTTRGLDWPAMRRRLLAWAAALPPAAPTDPRASYARLCAAFGPLADATTHGLAAPTRRAPWLPRRAAEVWAAACAGPLGWLGALPEGVGPVGGVEPASSAAPLPTAHITPEAEAGDADHTVQVTYGKGDADVLDLARFATFVGSDTTGERYRVSPRSIAAGAARGYDPARLRAMLLRRGESLPAGLEAALTPDGGLRLCRQTVLLSDDPADLTVALRRRSARRVVAAQLAPGVALVTPGGEAALTRALARDGRAVTPPPAPDARPPAAFTPSEAATLLLAAAFYRAQAPADGPPGPDAALLDRLRVALSPALAAATDATIAALTAREQQPAGSAGAPCSTRDRLDGAGRATPLAEGPPDDEAPTVPAPPLAELILALRKALRRRAAVRLRYQGADEPLPLVRVVRPLRIERHGPWWYLHAYCLRARAERCFRLDRVVAIELLLHHGGTARKGRGAPAAPLRRPAPQRPRNAPRTGFFAGPPDPPHGSRLVRVWLDDDGPTGGAPGAAAIPSDEGVRWPGAQVAEAASEDDGVAGSYGQLRAGAGVLGRSLTEGRDPDVEEWLRVPHAQ